MFKLLKQCPLSCIVHLKKKIRSTYQSWKRFYSLLQEKMGGLRDVGNFIKLLPLLHLRITANQFSYYFKWKLWFRFCLYMGLTSLTIIFPILICWCWCKWWFRKHQRIIIFILAHSAVSLISFVSLPRDSWSFPINSFNYVASLPKIA